MSSSWVVRSSNLRDFGGRQMNLHQFTGRMVPHDSMEQNIQHYRESDTAHCSASCNSPDRKDFPDVVTVMFRPRLTCVAETLHMECSTQKYSWMKLEY